MAVSYRVEQKQNDIFKRYLSTGDFHIRAHQVFTHFRAGELVHVMHVDGTSTDLSEQGGMLQCSVAQYLGCNCFPMPDR